MITEFILAGTHAEAKYYAREKGLKKWVFLQDTDQLVGIINPAVHYVGTWNHRPHREIDPILKQIEFRKRIFSESKKQKEGE